jgi:hypothetical protein
MTYVSKTIQLRLKLGYRIAYIYKMLQLRLREFIFMEALGSHGIIIGLLMLNVGKKLRKNGISYQIMLIF